MVANQQQQQMKPPQMNNPAPSSSQGIARLKNGLYAI
jgi:hypothetical protein